MLIQKLGKIPNNAPVPIKESYHLFHGDVIAPVYIDCMTVAIQVNGSTLHGNLASLKEDLPA